MLFSHCVKVCIADHYNVGDITPLKASGEVSYTNNAYQFLEGET